MSERRPVSYREAGVDIEEGDRFVERIRKAAESTHNSSVLQGLGAFAGLYRADFEGIEEPVLVASADGIGTKLKLAFATGAHASVGGDLVRHCANDIAAMGAKPLFFLDYLATAKLSAEALGKVVQGMAEACRAEGIALLGGETAEMPGFYTEGEYDVAGFVVGVLDRSRIVDGRSIKPGDLLIGFPSTGLHTNGYSLARRIVEETPELDLEARPEELCGATLAEALLAPHRSYTAEARRLGEESELRGLAHVTGGGIAGNLSRILPEQVDAVVNQHAWEEPPIFDVLRRFGRVGEDEMRAAFNLGIGMVAVTSSEPEFGIPIGEVVVGSGKVRWGR